MVAVSKRKRPTHQIKTYGAEFMKMLFHEDLYKSFGSVDDPIMTITVL